MSLKLEMASALAAASRHSDVIDALMEEFRNSPEPDPALKSRIAEEEQGWQDEMARHSAAFNELHGL